MNYNNRFGVTVVPDYSICGCGHKDFKHKCTICPTGPTGATGPTGPPGIFNLVDGNTIGSVRGIHTPEDYYMGIDSLAIGRGTMSKGIASFAQGINSVVNGIAAVAEGDGTTADGIASHAEGNETVASGIASHAEGGETVASGNASHAEGSQTNASGENSHAEGLTTVASGNESHAEGNETNAIGIASHAEGNETTASGLASHAEGSQTNAQGNSSHAEGNLSSAAGGAAHAEGSGSIASGTASHAEGEETIASGSYSHAGGSTTIAQGYAQSAIGRWNVASGNADIPVQTDDAFIIGNGFFGSRNNAFRVQYTGDVHSATGLYTTGADYAEMFEWQDHNPEEEDRRGFFVTVEGKYIRKATAQDDFILGVITSSPSVVGDTHGLNWQGKFLRDKWGDILYEWADIQVEIPEANPETGGIQKRIETIRIQRPRLNPEYDANRTYQPRVERREWAAVGLIGKLIVRDDGSCQPNGNCRPNDHGIGTPSEQGFRVLERLDSDTILICRV